MTLLDGIDKEPKKKFNFFVLILGAIFVLSVVSFFLSGPWRWGISAFLMIYGIYKLFKVFREEHSRWTNYVFALGEFLGLLFLSFWIMFGRVMIYLIILGIILIGISVFVGGDKKDDKDLI